MPMNQEIIKSMRGTRKKKSYDFILQICRRQWYEYYDHAKLQLCIPTGLSTGRGRTVRVPYFLPRKNKDVTFLFEHIESDYVFIRDESLVFVGTSRTEP